MTSKTLQASRRAGVSSLHGANETHVYKTTQYWIPERLPAVIWLTPVMCLKVDPDSSRDDSRPQHKGWISPNTASKYSVVVLGSYRARY